MIGWISGIIRHRAPGLVIVDAGGVGYELHVTSSTEETLGRTGDLTELHVHTHVREDAIVLYGFATPFDRGIFLQLINVSGIGPKTALGILSAVPSERLVQVIQSKNSAQLQGLPGIGKKTAERLMVELYDKFKQLALSPARGSAAASLAPSTLSDEVVSALVNLGYKQPMAEAALSRVDLSQSTSFDKILKETLRNLAK